MPERVYKSKFKVDSAPVQGADSWVILKRPTWADFEQALNGNSPEGQQGNMDIGRKILERMVEDWNWVGDDGEPLPKPSPDIVRALPFQEIQFLLSNLDLEELSQKN